MSMTVHDPHFSREPKGILRWLGFLHSDPEIAVDDPPVRDGNISLNDPRERRRRQVLDDICSFLITHRLEVSSYTLAIAHDVISGSNARLASLIEQRVQAREPVTPDWLEQAARSCGRDDELVRLEDMMTKLEGSIGEFSTTTSAARSATTEYNSALEVQVGELEKVGKAGAVINELAAIAKVMLARTREIEKEMQQSENQTKALQQKLEDSRREAEMDHLTGLPNRRAFEAALEREHAAALENGEALCVAFCNIDNFKRINDTHGHEAGDRILRTIAKSLAKISNEKCHVSRHGGEEFVALFRGKSLDEAWQILDDNRETISERRLVNRATDIPFGQITYSAGLAEVKAGSNPRAGLKAADKALYAAKNRGRNLVLKADDIE